MPQIVDRLKDILDQRSVPYEAIHHVRHYTAQRTAEETHVPGREFAKVVLLRVDSRYVMAVLPAHHRVNVGELRHSLGARDVRLAAEDELHELCPDCEVGAAPPFGNLYGVPVYISSWMMGDEHITFNAGNHEEAIRMKFQDYLDVVRPTVIDFSTQH